MHSFIFISGLGAPEIILIVIAILVLFGAKKIPEFMRGLGQGIREFKSASNNVRNEIQREADQISLKAGTQLTEQDKTL
jgi:sec-independent protein translocase protein TatA